MHGISQSLVSFCEKAPILAEKRNAMLPLIGLMICLLMPPDRDEALIRAVRVLTGAWEAEQLDESEWERFSALAARPIPLNRSPRSRLAASGLFSPYQLATLQDYRARNGDILSFAELGCVDGFGEEIAAALRLFVTLEPSLQPGALPGDARNRGESELSTAWVQKTDASADGQGFRYGLKYRHTQGERWVLAVAGRSTFGEKQWPPASRTGYLLWHAPRGQLIVGSFHARFGEGLSRWTGFALSDLSTVRSFSRRATQLTPAWTYDGGSCLHGLAGQLQWGSLQLAGYATLPRAGAFETGGHLDWTGRHGQGGATLIAKRSGGAWSHVVAALDGRFHIRGTDFFGEAAWRLPEKSAALRGGVQRHLADGVQGGLLLRAVPSAFSQKKNGEYALAAGVDFGAGPYVPLAGKSGFGSSRRRHAGALAAEFSALPVPGGDTRRKQWKISTTWQFQLNGIWALNLRVTERLRNFDQAHRSGVRLDLLRESGPWNLRFRTEAVASEGWGFLGYSEAGWKRDRGWVWLRASLFFIDHWEDRIYCHERGAPGSFHVPARYGRGYALSAVAAVKSRRLGHWYLRTGWTGYFPGEEKSGKAEAYLVGIFKL